MQQVADMTHLDTNGHTLACRYMHAAHSELRPPGCMTGGLFADVNLKLGSFKNIKHFSSDYIHNFTIKRHATGNHNTHTSADNIMCVYRVEV
jgi:hypothetical protein